MTRGPHEPVSLYWLASGSSSKQNKTKDTKSQMIYADTVKFKLLNYLEKIGQGHLLSNSSKSFMRPIQHVDFMILKQIFLMISCSQGFRRDCMYDLKGKAKVKGHHT